MANDTAAGVFVAIEGIDGAGKSRTIDHIRKAPWFAREQAVLVDKRVVFPAGYLAQHGETLRRLLWGEGLDQERNQVPDLHWVHLSASWFILVDHAIVRPALGAGRLVVADSWTAKQTARFALKPPAISDALAAALASVSVPDRTLFIDVDPEIAAERKAVFGYSETGQFDGYKGLTRENFLAYQGRVRASYFALAGPSWMTLDGASGDPALQAAASIRAAAAVTAPGSAVAPADSPGA